MKYLNVPVFSPVRIIVNDGYTPMCTPKCCHSQMVVVAPVLVGIVHAHESSFNPYFTGQISYNPSETTVISQLVPNDFANYSHSIP